MFLQFSELEGAAPTMEKLAHAWDKNNQKDLFGKRQP
jgi:hypothetical protein